MKLKNIISKSLFVVAVSSLFVFPALPVFSANVKVADPGTNATGNGSAITITDVLTNGTNTTHSQIVELQGQEDVYILFHCPLNGVTVGTATFGLEESMDAVTWGSVTACEMTRATNTLLASTTYGSNTTDRFAGEYRGTNTSSFVGVLGTSTALTTQFYRIKPYGTFLRTQCTLTSTGTDTITYKTILRKGTNQNKF